jgi:thymidylate synthase
MNTPNAKFSIHLRAGFIALALTLSGTHYANSQIENFPIANKVADKVIQKYQMSSCADLKQSKATPPSGQEAEMMAKAMQQLKTNPQMRTAFVNKIAPTVVNKMFECGMIP